MNSLAKSHQSIQQKPSIEECRRKLKQGLQSAGFSPSEIRKVFNELDSGCSCNAEMQQKLQALERQIGAGQGGTAHPGNRNEFTTGGQTPGSPGHGGEIRFGTQTIDNSGAVGDTEVATPADDEESARLSGQKICSVYILPNDTELDNDKGNIVCSLKLNGTVRDEMRNVPLWRITPSADDELQKHDLPSPLFVSQNDVLQIEFELISTLTTSTDGDLTPWVNSASHCA